MCTLQCAAPTLLLRGVKGVTSWVSHRVRRRRTVSTAAHLALDCWGVIVDFLGTDVLAEVNSFLRTNLPRRHLRLMVSSANADRMAMMYMGDHSIQVMSIQCKELSDKDGHNLVALADMLALQQLSLELFVHQFGNAVADATVEALSALHDAEELRHLYLDLHYGVGGRGKGNLTDAASIALAELRKSQSLETLCIDLSCNNLSPTSGKALASLAAAERLRSLELKLVSTPIRDEGIVALAHLRRSRTLESLVLNLRSTGVSDAGVKALAALKDAPALRYLQLDLSCGKVGDVGVKCLVAALKCAPRLNRLTLNLASTAVREDGLKSLADLREAPALQHLTLVLGPDITDSTAEALRTLVDAPQLRSLCLDLSHSRITDLGAQLLAGLKESRTLEMLSLDLGHGIVTDAGAKSLVELQHCQTLQYLTVNLRSTRVSDQASQALLQMKARRPWRKLEIISGVNTMDSLC